MLTFAVAVSHQFPFLVLSLCIFFLGVWRFMATLLVMCVLAFHVSLLPHLMHLHVYLHTCIDIAVFRALHHRAGFLALLWARFTLVSIGRVHLCFLNRHEKPSASRIELIPNPDNACSPDWSPFKSFPTACSPNSCNI